MRYLKEVDDPVRNLHQVPLRPVSYQVEWILPRDEGLWDYEDREVDEPNKSIGVHHEHMAIALYGGRHNDERMQDELFDQIKKGMRVNGHSRGRYHVHNPRAVAEEVVVDQPLWGVKETYRRDVRTNSGRVVMIANQIEPDFVDEERRRVGECKMIGEEVYLWDRQVFRNGELKNSERFDGYGFYYVITPHNLGPINSFEGTHLELAQRLARAIPYSMVLPLSVVTSLHGSYKHGNGLVGRYEGKSLFGSGSGENKKGPYTRLWRETLDELLIDPAKIIEATGLHAEDYAVARFKSPRALRLDGVRVKQFPIMWIAEASRLKMPDTQLYDSHGRKINFELLKSREVMADNHPDLLSVLEDEGNRGAVGAKAGEDLPF